MLLNENILKTSCNLKHITATEEVVERAKQSFNEGVCEVWLTSEDTGAYGRDIGVTLPQLLWQLVEVIPEGCRLRLGMTNPPYILDHLKVKLSLSFVQVLYVSRLCFLHLYSQMSLFVICLS